MDINISSVKNNFFEFAEKNDIAIIAIVDLSNRRFEIIKRDIRLESYDLFEQLILFNNIDNLIAYVEGRMLPIIWGQGNTKCVICKANHEQLVALFYDKCMDAKDDYLYSKKLEELLKGVV